MKVGSPHLKRPHAHVQSQRRHKGLQLLPGGLQNVDAKWLTGLAVYLKLLKRERLNIGLTMCTLCMRTLWYMLCLYIVLSSSHRRRIWICAESWGNFTPRNLKITPLNVGKSSSKTSKSPFFWFKVFFFQGVHHWWLDNQKGLLPEVPSVLSEAIVDGEVASFGTIHLSKWAVFKTLEPFISIRYDLYYIH